eukprot:269220-Rhodomonas_salina.2
MAKLCNDAAFAAPRRPVARELERLRLAIMITSLTRSHPVTVTVTVTEASSFDSPAAADAESGAASGWDCESDHPSRIAAVRRS